ncbi:MAG: hypothetical protein E7A06_12395 [Clostridiales bacterium]|nr:hypothetical protein [Clostridiales bacterium]
MRRVLRGITTTTLALTLTLTPALADDSSVDLNQDDSGSANVVVKAKTPGKKSGHHNKGPRQSTPNKPRAKSPKKPIKYDYVNTKAPTKPIKYDYVNAKAPTKPTIFNYIKTGRKDYNLSGIGPFGRFNKDLAFPTIDFNFPTPNNPNTQPEPQPAPAPQVNPETLAQEAVSDMGLQAPEISSTPNNPNTLGAVGLPVWYWVENPGPTTTGPNTTTAAVGSVSVTATAKFKGLTIDTGDGNTITCSGPGTPYPGTGIEESPDCGHIYTEMSDDQPGQVYTVNTTAKWEVTWTSNTGASGTIPVNLTTSKEIRIGSYQTVVTAQN